MITISVIESAKEIISQIPEYITVSISGVSNANVFYTFDGSQPDPTGVSASTLIMQHTPGNPLSGTVFLPTNNPILFLNILAVSVSPTDIATFYRRYGLDSENIGIGRERTAADGYVVGLSPNVTTSGTIIASDGYTEGSVFPYNITQDGYDGYIDAYGIAASGQQTTIPSAVYDHIDGYVDGADGNVDGYYTTRLTPAQEVELRQVSDRGPIFTDDGSGLKSTPNAVNIDPRSSTIIDSEGRQIGAVPVESYPIAGYTKDAYAVDINFDNAPIQSSAFVTGGMFNPKAAYIEIDGRVDGYINGQAIQPGDRVIINKPYGELRYNTRKEDLGDAIRTTTGYISGGLSNIIYDPEKGQIFFYYFDHHDLRWLVSMQKIGVPNYSMVAQRNGVVTGWVFKWITGRRQVVPA